MSARDFACSKNKIVSSNNKLARKFYNISYGPMCRKAKPCNHFYYLFNIGNLSSRIISTNQPRGNRSLTSGRSQSQLFFHEFSPLIGWSPRQGLPRVRFVYIGYTRKNLGEIILFFCLHRISLKYILCYQSSKWRWLNTFPSKDKTFKYFFLHFLNKNVNRDYRCIMCVFITIENTSSDFTKHAVNFENVF